LQKWLKQGKSRVTKKHPASASLDRFRNWYGSIQKRIREKSAPASVCDRWKSLHRHWPELFTAFELAYGPPSFDWRACNRKRLNMFCSFLRMFVSSGPTAIKQWAHRLRQTALEKSNIGGKDLSHRVINVFVASTVTRCFFTEVTKTQAETATTATYDRWLDGTKEILQDRWTDEAERLVQRMVTRRNQRPLTLEQERSREWPHTGDKVVLPVYMQCICGGNDSSCKTRTRDYRPVQPDGTLGSARCTEEMVRYAKHYGGETLIGFFESAPTARMETGEVDTLAWARAMDTRASNVRANTDNAYPSGEMVLTQFVKNHTLDEPLLKAATIPEMGGKIRIASTHSCDEVYTSRRLTQLWMPQLRRLAPTRHTLRGESIRLTRRPGSVGDPRSVRLYSADLSAATDWIPHTVARRIARVVNGIVFDDPQKWNDVTDIIFGPHKIIGDRTIAHTEECLSLDPEDLADDIESMDAATLIEGLEDNINMRVTKRGIHMGLGPSWIVLSLLNVAAAEYACGDSSAYRVCGDDLIGLFTPGECERYVAFLEGLGLKVNGKKSFYSQSGVFCEQLVLRSGPLSAQSYDFGHLAEAGASKFKANVSGDRYATEKLRLYQPNWPRPLNRLRIRTNRELTRPLGRWRGPVAAGGSGLPGFDARLLTHLIESGKSATVRHRRTPYGEALHDAAIQQHQMEKGQHYMKVEDAHIYLMRAERTSKLVAGKHPAPPKQLPTKAFQKRTRGWLQRSPPDAHSLRQLTFSNAGQRSYVKWVLKQAEWRDGGLTQKWYNRLGNFFLRSQLNLVVKITDLERILWETVNVPHGFLAIPDLTVRDDGGLTRQSEQ
jgi:hypothetical protein